MLQLLRKHQKVLLSIVAVFTIASFLFFGSYSVMQPSREIPDQAIGKTINGKPIMREEFTLLTNFLNTSPYERQIFEKGGAPNLLNDGVVQKDFFQTGFAVMLAERNFDFLKPEIEKKMERVKNFRRYVHPQAPFLSSQGIWQNLLPSLNLHYDALLKKVDVDAEVVALLSSLYLDQTHFPPDILRNILKYHQGQYDWLPADPFLDQGDLSIFGFTTLEDWMGHRLLSLMAQVILNGAALSQEQGHKVSLEEARASLYRNVHNAIIQVSGKEVTEAQVDQIYHKQTAMLHWQEDKVVAVWQKVLLFRKLLRDQGSSIIVDPQSLAASAAFAEELVKVDLYSLPSELELRNFRDLLKLQTYLEAVSPTQGRKTKSVSLGLPVVYATLDEIANRCPELVQTKVVAELQSVRAEQLATGVTLKDVYAWELEEQHWGQLCKAFPILQNRPSGTREDRYQALEKLPLQERASVDFYAKLEIVKAHPEWLESAFVKASKEKVEFGLRSQGGNMPLQGSIDREELKALLEKTAVGSVVSYSPDDKHCYRITLLQPMKPQEILSFAEARQDGTLDTLIDRQLTQSYPEVRKKHPALFALKDGEWKPFKEVQDLVGAEVYADLLSKIEEASQRLGVSWPAQRGAALDEYAKYRLITHLDEARNAISGGASEEGWIRSNVQGDRDIAKQWRLFKEEHTLKRNQATELSLQGLFDSKVGQWSPVQFKMSGSSYFYLLREKMNKEGRTDAIIDKTRELLSLDAERIMLSDILEKMAAQDVLIIPTRNEDEI